MDGYKSKEQIEFADLAERARICFGDERVNMSKIARLISKSGAYVKYVLDGEREPSAATLDHLRMKIEELERSPQPAPESSALHDALVALERQAPEKFEAARIMIESLAGKKISYHPARPASPGVSADVARKLLEARAAKDSKAAKTTAQNPPLTARSHHSISHPRTEQAPAPKKSHGDA